MTVIDSYERMTNEVNTLPPIEQTHRGLRYYDILCAKMINPNSGDTCVVRKDPVVDHRDPTDWHVVLGGVTEVVLAAQCDPDPTGDTIHLTIAPCEAHIGPSVVHFTVTPEYGPTNTPVEVTRAQYYGRNTQLDTFSLPPPHIVSCN